MSWQGDYFSFSSSSIDESEHVIDPFIIDATLADKPNPATYNDGDGFDQHMSIRILSVPEKYLKQPL
jgi:hypothetical protein